MDSKLLEAVVTLLSALLLARLLLLFHKQTPDPAPLC